MAKWAGLEAICVLQGDVGLTSTEAVRMERKRHFAEIKSKQNHRTWC